MFGTGAPYTQATNHWDDNLIAQKDLRFYGIALPQTYLEVGMSWGQLAERQSRPFLQHHLLRIGVHRPISFTLTRTA